MAIICLDGFETGSTVLPDSFVIGGGFQAATGRDGIGRCIQNSTGTILNRGLLTGKIFSSATDTIYGHAGVYVANFSSATPNDSQVNLVFLTDLGTVEQLNVQHTIDGHLELRLGGTEGALLQTSTLTIPASAGWHSFEFKVKLANSGGEFILKVDGDEFLNYTGDTQYTGSSRVDAIAIRSKNSVGERKLDDVLICDTTGLENNSWTGEVSIVGIRPAANGANSGLTGSDGNSVNNYQQVDEVTISTADYNGSGTVGALDTYDFAAIGKIGTIKGIQHTIYTAKSDASAKGFKFVTRSQAGTLYKSSAIPLLTTSYTFYSELYTTDPDALGWTVSRVDNAEFGFEVA